MSNLVTITPSSVSSIFKVIDNRITDVLKKTVTPTTNTTLLYKSGSDLTPTNLGKLSN